MGVWRRGFLNSCRPPTLSSLCCWWMSDGRGNQVLVNYARVKVSRWNPTPTAQDRNERSERHKGGGGTAPRTMDKAAGKGRVAG